MHNRAHSTSFQLCNCDYKFSDEDIFYLGYAYGSAPIVAFNYGAGKKAELQNVLKKSLKLLLGTGIVLLSIGVLFAGVLSGLFVGYDAQLYAMTVRGLLFYAVS